MPKIAADNGPQRAADERAFSPEIARVLVVRVTVVLSSTGTGAWKGDEPVTKVACRMVPLAVPVRVGDHEHSQRRRHARSVRRTCGAHKAHNATRGASPKAAPRAGTLEPSSDDGAASRDETIDDHDQREHEQQMNEPATDVEGERAECPQDEQDDRECEEHGVHPRVRE